jgi:hypothetical protein
MFSPPKRVGRIGKQIKEEDKRIIQALRRPAGVASGLPQTISTPAILLGCGNEWYRSNGWAH